VLVVDAATGRVEHRYENGGDTSSGLYWLAGDNAHARIIAVGFNCAPSGGCGPELTVIGSGGSDDFGAGDTDASATLKEGVMLVFDPTSLDVYQDASRDIPIGLPRMSPSAPFGVVADVAHDRLFAISSAGLVAEIDHVAGRTSISYHAVDLNGQPFQAAWAGTGRIALWGRDGLGMINTHTWTTQAVAAGVTGAVATPLGLAAWTTDPTSGLTIYRSDGSKRLQVLVGKPIRAVRAFRNFLYVDADGPYSVDLRTGKVFGPLANRARVVTPTLVPIP